MFFFNEKSPSLTISAHCHIKVKQMVENAFHMNVEWHHKFFIENFKGITFFCQKIHYFLALKNFKKKNNNNFIKNNKRKLKLFLCFWTDY